MNQHKQIGRLAMRKEGDFWNAYYALKDTMDGALLLGSIRMAAVVENRSRKDAFMKMMQDIVSDILEDGFGERPEWGEPKPGPESERSGHA